MAILHRDIFSSHSTPPPHTGVLSQHVSRACPGPLPHLIAFPCRYTVDLFQIGPYTAPLFSLGLCYTLTLHLQLILVQQLNSYMTVETAERLEKGSQIEQTFIM